MMTLTQSDGLEEKRVLNSPFNTFFKVLERINEKTGFLRNLISFSRMNGDGNP